MRPTPAGESDLTELERMLHRFPLTSLVAGLKGEPSCFDVDGRFTRRSDNLLQATPTHAFDGHALLAAGQAIAWLAHRLPVGAELRDRVPAFYARVRERLSSSTLVLDGGFPLTYGPHAEFTPAKLTEAEKPGLQALAFPIWKSEKYPFASYYPPYATFVSPAFERLVARVASTPLAAGKWEADPRASVPELVEQLSAKHALSEDAATLYLQLLTLVDCSDKDLSAINGWDTKRLKAAAKALVAKGLVVEEKKARSGRAIALLGPWEKLSPPSPGIERDKLELYDARMDHEMLAAPLGRLLPLAPIHELFATAWAKASKTSRTVSAVSTGSREDELLAAVVRSPADDAARAVYADALLERGDPRGEIIALSLRDKDAPGLAKLLADTELTRTSLLQQHAVKWTWDRGFVDAVHMKIPVFVKHGERMMKEHPLFRRLVIDMGLRRITEQQMDALGASPLVGNLIELDFGDHFIHARDFVRCLNAARLDNLEILRIGANTRGGGIGKSGAKAIATSAKLSNVRVLDLPGQAVGDDGALALAHSSTLSKLEELRLPMNGLTDVGARALLDRVPKLKLDLTSPLEHSGHAKENKLSPDTLASMS